MTRKKILAHVHKFGTPEHRAAYFLAICIEHLTEPVFDVLSTEEMVIEFAKHLVNRCRTRNTERLILAGRTCSLTQAITHDLMPHADRLVNEAREVLKNRNDLILRLRRMRWNIPGKLTPAA
jgi:hypothetical protein